MRRHRYNILIFPALVIMSLVSVSWTDRQPSQTNEKGNGTLPLLCYFDFQQSWPDNGTLHPALNATLCTHIIFISTSTNNCKISLKNPSDGTKYLDKIPLLRKINPNLQLMVSNGGGDNVMFSYILASAPNRTIFVNSILPFLRKYGLDGLDMDWEFPGWGGLPREQRKNFTTLMQQLRDMFDEEARTGRKYYLSAAVAAGRSVMEIYDVPALARSVDWINMMGYDYHSYASYDPITDFNSPLYPTDWWKKIVIFSGNIGWSSYEWHKRGMPKAKIMVGVPTYTHTYTLMFPDKYHGLYAPAKGPGKTCNECSYAWVCDFIRAGATVVFDEDAFVPYMYHGDQWVSYDNVRSLTRKAQWVVDEGFGGVMVYCLNTDDFGNKCGEGKFPLVSAIREVINNNTNSLPQTLSVETIH